MTDEKDSLTSRDLDGTRQIEPWLLRRLENRARPLTRLMKGIEGGNRLVQRVIRHMNIASAAPRAQQFASRVFNMFGSKKTNTYSPYSMLNLPWLNTEQAEKPEPIQRIHADQWYGTVAHAPFKQETAKIKPSYGPVTDKQAVGKDETPATYIEHLASPPIMRASANDFVQNILNPAAGTSSVSHVDKAATVHRPSVDRDTIILPPVQNEEKNLTEGYKEKATGQTKTETVTHHANPQQLGAISRKAQSLVARITLPTASAVQRSLTAVNARITDHVRPKSARVKNITGSMNLTPVSPQYGNRAQTEEDKLIGTDGQNSKLVDISSTDSQVVSRELYGTGKLTAKRLDTSVEKTGTGVTDSDNIGKPAVKKLVTSLKKTETGITESTKGLSLGQRIVQSLPFLKNISRKMSQPEAKVQKDVINKVEIQRNQRPMDKFSPIYHRTPEEKPDNLSDVVKTEVEPATGVIPVNEAEPAEISRIEITRAVNDVKPVDLLIKGDVIKPPQLTDVTEINPVKNLLSAEKSITGNIRYSAKETPHEKLPLIGSRVTQSLPISGTISRKSSMVPESSLLSARKKPVPPSISFSRIELDKVPLQRAEDITTSESSGFPMPPFAFDKTSPAAFNMETYIEREMDNRVNETPINKELNMSLAPVYGIQKVEKVEDYLKSNNTTQYVQRAQLPQSGQPIQRVQTGQSSQTVQSQTTTETQIENTSPKESQPDIRELARQIYPLIKKMIIIERERRPS